jgi:hypothetical protein
MSAPSIESFLKVHEALNSGSEIEAIVLASDDNSQVAAKLQKPLETCDELALLDLTPGVKFGVRKFLQAVDATTLGMLSMEAALLREVPIPPGFEGLDRVAALKDAVIELLRVERLRQTDKSGYAARMRLPVAVERARTALLMCGLTRDRILELIENKPCAD